MTDPTHGYWVVLLTFFVALMLSVSPLPAMLPDYLAWAHPDWVALALIYWVLALPHRVGIVTGWVLGLLEDALLGMPLGMHGIVLVLIAWLTINLYQRLRMFSAWQQGMVVFAMVGVSQFIQSWVAGFFGDHRQSLWLLLPAVVSALLWPWVFRGLRRLRRQFNVD